MRAHYIQTHEKHGFWIDLDHVLTIHDPLVPSRNEHLKSMVDMFPGAAFGITLAFQDRPFSVESYDRSEGAIDMVLTAHAKLLKAWKS